MSEEKIAERIDANLFDVPIQDLKALTKDSYMGRVTKLKAKTHGKLVVKEYPTASAHAGHFRALIEELKMKKNFKADIIFVDYMNICASQRVNGSNANSYTIVKSIAEELRALAMTYEVPLFTATQLTRSNLGASDVDLTSTSESIGTAFTADLMLALIATEELEKMGQMMIKQLKNRYGDLGHHKRFVVGVDKSRMKFFNLEDAAQDDIANENHYQSPEEPKYGNKPALKTKFAGFQI
jgi:hypothetical protein